MSSPTAFAGPDDEPLLRPPPLATFDTSPRQLLIPRWMLLAGLIVAEALLARYMTQIPRLGQVQALVVVALILYAAMKRNMPLMLCVAAYIPGAEIMWRQAQVFVPFLIAPYLLMLISALSLVTMYRNLNRSGRTALLYLMLLLPSAILTFSVAQGNARMLFSFALSGPAALVGLIALFSQLTIQPWLYRRLLWTMLISGVGPLSIALTAISDYIGTTGSLDFGSGSNSITSGGFGPVQVSSLMGLTVIVSILIILAEHELAPRLIAGAVGLWSGVQSLLTFSRGGMTATAIAIAGLVILQTRDRRSRRKVIALVGFVLLLGYLVIIPRLDAFTNGGLEKRFSDTQTGRTSLASNDVQIFVDHPLFGVGPGMSKYERVPYEICQLRADRCQFEGSSHTEFTRMLAEHGIPGIIGIVLLGMLAWQALRQAGDSLPLTLVMLLWTAAQMFYANLRIAAVPFAFAFAFIRVRSPDPPPEPEAIDEVLDPAFSG